MFCKTCGAEIPDDSVICSQCHNDPRSESTQQEKRQTYTPVFSKYKSRLLAGILQILLAPFGAGRLYLGYVGIALLQILAVVMTSGLAIIWPVIDGIRILMGYVKTDAFGQPLS